MNVNKLKTDTGNYQHRVFPCFPLSLHLFFTQLLVFLISAINLSLSEESESYKLETMSSQSQISTDVPVSSADGFSFP